MRRCIVVAIVVVTAAAAGCSGTRGKSPTSVRVSSSVTSKPVSSTTATAPKLTTVVSTTTTSPSTTGGRNVFGGNSPEDKRMPDVVCMNLQKAQNEIQDHGVFLSKSVDATGKGRRQLIDNNWIVVSQKPAAGEKIGEGDAVLSVVKTDEPNACK
jgi:hypothetical protein